MYDINTTHTPKGWNPKATSNDIPLFLLAAFIGLVAGFLAFLLRTSIWSISEFLLGHYIYGSFFPAAIFLPMAGIIIAVAFQKLVIKRELGHGTEKMEEAVKKRRVRLPFSDLYGQIIASIITLGLGGSAGAGGPIASAGAAFASKLGQRLELSERTLYILVGCGAGAGIAGLFKAPIGGVMFVIEALGMGLSAVSFIAIAISCIVSAMTTYWLSGFSPGIALGHMQNFDPTIMGWVIAFGVFCGIYSVYYLYIGTLLRWFYERIPSIWLRALASGAVLSALVLLFPAFFGEGYDIMANLMDGDISSLANYDFFKKGDGDTPRYIILVCAGLAVFKSAASTSSNSGGGIAGDITPSMFAGCATGALFSEGLKIIFGLGLPSGNFALIGMAATMAGIIKAPLMAIFIVLETTGCYNMFFPVVFASSISYATMICLSSIKNRAT